MPSGKLAAQVVALAAVAVMLVVLIWHLLHQPAKVAVGDTAPSFVLQRLDRDGLLDLASLRGKPVVLNFWASWCGPCKREASVLEDAARRGVTVVGVDVNDDDGDARRFMRAHGITYPVVRDPSSAIANSYNVPGLPTTFFLDRDGRLSGRHVLGAIEAAELAAGVKAAAG